MSESGKLLPRVAWTLGGLAVAGVFAVVVWRSQQLPQGPQPIVWDHEACAECRMTVSDPRFACQLQTMDGRVLDFDDPGCLFRFLSDENPPVHALYFRAYDEDRWLRRDEVAFVTEPGSPMGYDLAAVSSRREDGLDFEHARERVLPAESSHVAP